MYSAGGAIGAETGDNFAAFDTHETTDSAEQIDKMANLTVNDATLVSLLYKKLILKTFTEV